MTTNEFFKGYFQALNTIEENVDHRIESAENFLNYEMVIELKQIKNHIQSTREAYQKLIIDLNEKNK